MLDVFPCRHQTVYYLGFILLILSTLPSCGSRPLPPQYSEARFASRPALSNSVCGTPYPISFAMQQRMQRPYKFNGKTFYPIKNIAGFQQEGIAVWYGIPFQGKTTASGEIFDRNNMTTSHPTLPMNTCIKVTNLANGYWLVLRVNDRGPFNDNRILDVSEAAARFLGFLAEGTAEVRLEVLP